MPTMTLNVLEEILLLDNELRAAKKRLIEANEAFDAAKGEQRLFAARNLLFMTEKEAELRKRWDAIGSYHGFQC
jgi:hypothetical protein